MPSYDWLKDEPTPSLIRLRKHARKILQRFEDLIREIDRVLDGRKAKAAAAARRIVVFVALLSAAGCLPYAPPPELEPPRARRVTYMVSGSVDRAGLTYRNASGGTEQRLVALPWELEFHAMPGEILYLAAQKKREGGTIAAAIWVDGTQLQAAESNDAYGIAQTSASVPRPRR